MARAPALQQTEALPEVDRLEGFPHPRNTRDLFGHQAAERLLAEAFASGRMHHAWLLAGPAGIGKATLAYRFAAYAFAVAEERDPLGATLALPEDTVARRQVKALSHPGLLVIRRPCDPKTKRFAATIPVDEVRRLRGFLSRTAEEGAWRAVIVDQGDELNVNSANALLKSLEEPPPRALFLIVASEPGRLLPTIRSRCRRLLLAPLDADALQRAATCALETAQARLPDENDWPRLTRLARGSVRRLLMLAAADGLELYERVLRFMAALPKVDWVAAHALSDELAAPAAEQRFNTFFELLLDSIAAVTKARATGAGGEDEVTFAVRLIPDGRLASWSELWETVVREKAEALALNLDRKMLILETLSRIGSAARR
jgi:DNA polymerase III subunit delta'